MDRWTWMALKVYAPSIGMGLLALVLMLMTPDQPNNPLVAPFAQIFQWASLAAMLAALGLGAIAAYSLWRWERGEALICDCGGLLGRERDGVRGRTDYRKCLACGKNVSSRYYE
jgi:hypothetical protein